MKSLLLIDLSGIFRAYWHATESQEVSAAYELTVGKVAQMRSGFDYTAVCCDAPPYFRKELSPAYKAQRDAPPPQLSEQLRRVKERLVFDGCVLWEHRGFEADDVIATAALLATGSADPLSVTIASGDKDLLQLVSDARRVAVFSPQSGKTLAEAQVLEKFGVLPGMIGDLLAMAGDSADGIKGLDGVGLVKGAKLLSEWGTLEGVLTHADDIPTPALRRAIQDGAACARLARKLVTLRYDVPINFPEIFEARTPQPLRQETMEDIDNETSGDAADDGIPDDVLPPVRTLNESEIPPPPRLTDTNAEKPEELVKRLATEQPSGLVPAPRTELAQRGPFEYGLEPTSLGGAYKLACGMHNSRLYQKFATAEACWAVMIRGREMGLGALTALDCFHVIEGKPAIHAHLVIARAKEHPDCEWFRMVSSDDEHAEYETKNRRNPDVTRLRYTLEMAKQAGLCPDRPRTRNPSPGEKDRRGNWEKRPSEMLRKTAGVQLARAEYPSASLGLYSVEELEE